MKLAIKVRPEGGHFIGCLPSTSRSVVHGKVERSKKSILFDQYYLEAQKVKIPKKQICSYIEDRFMQEQDIADWVSSEEVQALYKNKLRNIHKRIQRYERKLACVDWNYYVTFTYDDEKETEDSFVKGLKKKFSNLKTRLGWLVMAIPEEGGEKGRKHYHAFIYVPEGKMVGKLYKRKLWSQKKRRWTYVTDNTYFSERFGISVWERINREDLRGSSLKNYLKKYLTKSGNYFFYSRGIPTEFDMEIDTDTDVFCTFYDYGVKVMLFDSLFYGSDRVVDPTKNLTFDWSLVPGFNLNNPPRLR